MIAEAAGSPRDVIARLVAELAAELDESMHSDATAASRFVLFHAANSICSQKVRVVLAHHDIQHISYALSIFAGETYLPSHVRLRMIGCERAGLPLVTGHSGSTSTSDEGCDPAVVPTLVDMATGEVVIDSKAICQHIDATVRKAARLRPESLADSVDAELRAVDNLPNYQMLFGKPAAGDYRPANLKDADGAQFCLGKVNRCDHYLERYAGDAQLVAAYRAKRAKELDAAESLFSNDAVGAAHEMVQRACGALDTRLAHGPGPWLFGEAATMADLFWAVELIRIENLGAGHFWHANQMPMLKTFLSRAKELDSVRAAVIDWPGALY